MDNGYSRILQPDELRKEMQDNGAVILGALNDQWTTLQLLSGKIPTGMDIHSQLFADMLGQLASQGNISGEQLAQSQHYSAAILESASLSALTLGILSGDVGSIIEKIETLIKCGDGLSTGLKDIVTQIGQLGSGGDGMNGAAGTLFGGIAAIGTVGDAGKNISTLAKVGGIAGKAAGLLGGFLSGPVAPLLLGGLAVAGVGTIAYKAYKNHQAKKEAQAADNPITERSIMDPIALEDTENARNRTPSLPERPPITERSIMDPVVLGTTDDMFAPQQARAADGGLLPTAAGAQHDRLVLADAALLSEISGLRQVMQKVADKPFDPNMRAEIIIQRAYSEMTQPELEQSIAKRFRDDWRGSATPRRL